jgi:N-acyl-D-amino-acid deacylase
MGDRFSATAWVLLFMATSLIGAPPPLKAGDAPQSTKAGPIITGKADPNLAPFDEMLSAFVAEQKIPGAAVAVARRGKLVYSRGFGYAEVEKRTPVDPAALFRIASISKPITAIAVLQLVEKGILSLDDRAFDKFRGDPEFKAHGKSDPRMATITIRQLLQHTAGWDREVSFEPMFRPNEIAHALKTTPPASQAQIIRYMGGQPLDFSPGERYAYSNFGYCVLGRIIAKVSGQSYEAYVKQHVLKPLGITRMKLGKTLREGRAEGEVCYYEPNSKHGPAVRGPNRGKEVPLPYGTYNLEAMDAHGGWIASAVDLVRLASAFDDPEHCPILKAATIAEMFARPKGLAGHDAKGQPKPAYYGMGWEVRPVGSQQGFNAWHAGTLDGTSTILVRRFDGLCWAVLFNTRNGGGKKEPVTLIDPLMHVAADKVQNWPEGTAFSTQH